MEPTFDGLSTIVAAVIAAVIVVIGWLVNAAFDRKTEVFKQRLQERLRRRMDMFDSVIDALIDYANGRPGADGITRYNIDDALDSKFNESRKKLHLYGMDDEIDAFDEFDGFCRTKSDSSKETGKQVHKAITLFRRNLRSDLDYKHK